MIRRGEVYFVALDPARGREQAGRRPVLVVSADRINRRPLVVTVVSGTDSSNVEADYPTNVRVPAAESGLPRDTVFLCFQLRSLDPRRFEEGGGAPRPLGRLPRARMQAVDAALRVVLDLPPS